MSMGSTPIDPCREQLRQILESKCFQNAESLRRLLSYLAERSLTHSSEELKEYTIGVEVFGRPASYDPQKDASVRVQVSRLRQKLEEYQKTEGRSDPYRVELPKGRFTIVFTPRNGQQPGASARSRAKAGRAFSPLLIGLGLALILLAVSATWTVLLWRKVDVLESRLATPPAPQSVEFETIWAGFFHPAAQNIVVFGSPPFFASTKHRLFVRMYRPDNPDNPRSGLEFQAVEARIGPLDGPRFDYASMGDAIAVQRLTAFFGSHGSSLRALPAHLTSWDTVQEANLIFIGAERMNPLLRRLPVQQDFELGTNDDYIHNRKPQPGEQAVYETPSHRDRMSYAVVATYPGLLPGREIVLLWAHSSPAAVGVANFVTSIEGVQVIREKLKLKPGEHKHFQVLLRVYSDNDAPVKTEYVTHHVAP